MLQRKKVETMKKMLTIDVSVYQAIGHVAVDLGMTRNAIIGKFLRDSLEDYMEHIPSTVELTPKNVLIGDYTRADYLK